MPATDGLRELGADLVEELRLLGEEGLGVLQIGGGGVR